MSIQGIDAASIHRLTSGQVVTDLQTCVKELVENSLDAGATSLEMRFKQYGLASVEVIDNGSGIAPADYDSVALKHYTSKLASFDDIASVRTFGFRGEALSSLCALCESVTVLTATEGEAPMGTVLEFDARGRVKSRSGKAARQRGTTVTLTKLFAPLPVRRKDLEKNAKREFGKALNLLQAYALVPCSKENGGVRFTVSNQLEVGGRKVQLQTKGNGSVQAAVTALWGPKAMDNVVTLDIALDVAGERSVLKRLGQPDATTHVQVKGLISKFMLGCGRQSSDRQYLFVNGRPCNLPKVQKAINETYRLFNATQTPFVVADIILPTDTCDINVSPDKRTIFLHSEGNLLTSLKEEFEKAFASSRSTYRINSGPSAFQVSLRDSEGEEEQDALQSDHEDKPSAPSTKLAALIRRTSSPTLTAAPATSSALLEARDPVQPSSTSLSTPPLPAIDPVLPPRTSPITSSERKTPLFLPDEDEAHELQSPYLPRRTPTLPLTTTIHAPSARSPELGSIEPARAPASASPSPEPEETMTADDAPSFRAETLMQTFKANRVPSPPSLLPRKGTLLSYFAASTSKSTSSRASTSASQRAATPAIARDSVPPRQWSAAPALRHKRSRDDDEPRPALGRGTPSPVAARLSKRFKALSPEPELDAQELLEIELDKLAGDECEDEAMEVTVPRVRLYTPASSRRTSTTSVVPSDAEVMDLTDASESPPKAKLLARSVTALSNNDPDATLTALVDLDDICLAWRTSTTSFEAEDEDQPAQADDVDGIEADAEIAEETLSRIIRKTDFFRMRIVGQFNLGFIIARLCGDEEHGAAGDDDLFIIDQHASDEKYNFETLQETTKMETQKLLRPRPLELTAADELLAIERIDVLRKNGFDLEVDEDAPARQRVKLTAIPVSKNTAFGVEDLEELIHLLRDSAPGHTTRCSKVRAMFAMRACRKSVMIGDALNMRQMKEIVSHMGTIEQPWNCPHGRPTMRHLTSLCHVQRALPSTPIDWSAFMSNRF